MIAAIANQFNEIARKYPAVDIDFLGNKIYEYAAFLIIFALLFLVLRIFRRVVLKRIKDFAEKADFGRVLISMIDTVKSPFYWFIAFYLSVNVLSLSPSFEKVIFGTLVVWIGFQAVIAAQVLIDYGLQKYSEKEKDGTTRTAMTNIGKISKGALWIFAILLILSNLGVNITSIVAGLGIGGVAVAFALQNILSDLFSSFAIYFDKPFVAGDFIVVGEHMGTVEKIGIKTTRLRALQGEEIVISNRELTTARVQNFKKMKKRRIVFTFGVVYDTPTEKIKKIPSIIGNIIKKEKLTELERVHFHEFGDSALLFEVVYYILSGNYIDYMDSHQNILLGIKESFEKEGISMAFPTQTVLIEKFKK